MLPKTHSQDLTFDEVWKEMDKMESLTPFHNKCKGNCKCSCVKTEDALETYRKAAESDAFLFGDYDGYDAYREDS